jgi:hypothetical protein
MQSPASNFHVATFFFEGRVLMSGKKKLKKNDLFKKLKKKKPAHVHMRSQAHVFRGS